jgi:hypothetical protein
VNVSPASTARFWAKVDKSPGQGPKGECWGWMACKTKSGHGRFGLDGRYVMAYRYSYVLHHGPIPDDQEIHHRCEYPPCVNPEHLIAATHREHNVLLTPHSEPAKNAAKTHCHRGHEFTPENTYRWAKTPTQRYCKTCRRERSRQATDERRQQRQEQGLFGKRQHPLYECERCGRQIRGKANLAKHQARPVCRPARRPPGPKRPPRPKPAPRPPATHCKNGHAISPENRRPRKSGTGSICILCAREHGKRNYYRHREKRVALVSECRRKRKTRQRAGGDTGQ